MQIFLVCAYACLFYFIIRRSSFFNVSTLPYWIPATVFLLKCVSGILLGLLYTYYYTKHEDADSFKFFTDSKYIFDSLTTKPYDFFRMLTGINEHAPELNQYYLKTDSWMNTNPIYNDNKTIIRLNTLFRFFSLGYYYVHVVFINFISFAGLFFLYKAFLQYVRNKEREIFLLTFLLPSVMFWGSGLLKDGILLFGFGLFIYSFTLLLRKFTVKRMVGLFAGLLVLFVTKVYVIALILPGIFSWWITRKKGSKTIATVFILSYIIYFSVAFNLYRINPDTNLAAELFYKQKNFIEIAEQHSASQIPFPRVECSATSILLHSPWAFANTMFRPFLTDVHGNPMILLSALENAFILILIVLCILTFNAKNKKGDGIIAFSIAFIVLLFILIGLSSPVLGAIVRYKIVALPSLMFLLVFYYDPSRLRMLLSKRSIYDNSHA